MFGDTEIQPPTTTPEPSPFPSQPITPPPYTPPLPPVPPAPPTTYIPKPKPSILPLLFGFLIVVIAAAAIGVVYYKTKLAATPTSTPVPTVTPSLEPSVEPSASSTSSASPKSSAKASGSPQASSRALSSPTSRASSTPAPTPTPTPTPVPQPTLDIRFGNPSANVKQTIDEGAGDGRVINREYTSIQTGTFDEVPSVWSPKVTICYHIVSNEVVPGKDVKLIFTLDDKAETTEYNLAQYDKLEAGRLYDWCHDVTTNIGKHIAKVQINSGKSLKEVNYTNDFARLDWENLADKIAPNYTLIGPNNEGANGTCLFPQYITDNVTPYSELKIEQKADAGDWTKFDGNRYCFTGTAGSSHTYTVKITDTRGNANEQKKTFVLY